MEEQKAWEAGENLLSRFCFLSGDLQVAGADVKSQWGRKWDIRTERGNDKKKINFLYLCVQ